MKFLTKTINWVKQEYIIDSLMINQMLLLNFFIWMPA